MDQLVQDLRQRARVLIKHPGFTAVATLAFAIGATTALFSTINGALIRLLHHAHVLKCGPKSWRTRAALGIRERTSDIWIDQPWPQPFTGPAMRRSRIERLGSTHRSLPNHFPALVSHVELLVVTGVALLALMVVVAWGAAETVTRWRSDVDRQPPTVPRLRALTG